MKISAVFLAMSCLMASVSAGAQTLNIQQRWHFNLDALRTLESYENCATLYGNAARMEFDMLFADRSMHIFNDLNGLSAAPTLSVADYSELLSTRGRSTQVIIKNLKKEEPYYDGAWKMDVSFDKEITYANACEILFSSKNYFGADFHIQMTLEWDEEMHQCTITKLSGERGSDVEMLPSDYTILTHTSDRDADLRVNGDTLHFNSFGQAFLPANPKFVYPDSDVRIKTVLDDKGCNTISLLYRPKRWRAKVDYAMNIGNFYPAVQNTDTKSKVSELSLELGYIFPSRSNVKWGFFFGAGLSTSQINADVKDMSYSYQASATADVDGDSYVRNYSIRDLSQTIKMTDLFVPVYLDMDARFNKYFSFYLDAGAKLYLNMKNELALNSGSYSTWGYYPQYGIEMRPEDHWGSTPINGFVTNANIAGSVSSAQMNLNKFSVDVLGRAGFRVLLYKDIFLDFGASYQMSVLAPGSSMEGVNLQSGTIPEQNALMNYTVNGGEAVHGILTSSSTFKRQALCLNVGLMFRF